MKITFVTSGLEPGANGVGDYTRRLAAELTRSGHACRLISLNEPSSQGERRVEGELRLGEERDWTNRIGLAEQALLEFKPDWTSLQFVSYGFDPRGIMRRRGPGLASLFSSRPTHLMFHEIWVGERKSAGWKERLVGQIQKKYILDMVRRMKPALVTTTNAVYRALLGRCGVTAEEYPLFGNVELGAASAGDWQEFRTAGVDVAGRRADYLLLGFFGILQSEWLPEPLFSRIAEAARKSQKRPVLIWIGRSGGSEQKWDAMRRDYASGFAFLRLGPQPSERVSELLNTLDAGISTMPAELISKSGTAVAMFEHGVPVVVTREEPVRGLAVGLPDEPLLCPLDDSFTERLLAGLRRAAPRSRLPEAASRMVRDLTALQDRTPGKLVHS